MRNTTSFESLTDEQKRFIARNKDFWQGRQESESEDILLVETSDNMVMNHSNAVAAKMLACAKKLRIGWMKYPFISEPLMKSYSAGSVFIPLPRLKFFKAVWFILLSAFYYFIYVLPSNRLKSFKHRGIPYGDFVYDGYLARFSYATLHRFDIRIIKVFCKLLWHDDQARAILDQHNIKAVLVAHYIGIEAGPLSRVAMQRNIPVYWKGGGHQIVCLYAFENLEQRYDYPLKPTLQEVDILAKHFRKKVEFDFNEFLKLVNNPFYGAFSVAYKDAIFNDVTRNDFLKSMGLEDKPVIFIMLHCFNDHPLSHFNSMLFDDYYDWFRKTLGFAIQDTSKNWIFKEHPANSFYPANDINMDEIMRSLPPHVKYAPCDSGITASTVLGVADTILTCLGTAGVEMPALRGIPSVIASESSFSGLGFSIEPKSRDDYFKVLKDFSIQPLTEEQQLRAKCSYIYMQSYVCVPFTVGPALTFEESRDPEELKRVYPQRILDAYSKDSGNIYSQFEEYVEQIRRPDFKRLRRFPIKEGAGAGEAPEVEDVKMAGRGDFSVKE